MALSNAERQARHRERVKQKLAAAGEIMREPLRNEVPTEAVLAWLSSAPADDEEREAFLRKLRHVISDWYVPIHWHEDCAAELHAAKGTPMPEALARKRAHLVT